MKRFTRQSAMYLVIFLIMRIFLDNVEHYSYNFVTKEHHTLRLRSICSICVKVTFFHTYCLLGVQYNSGGTTKQSAIYAYCPDVQCCQSANKYFRNLIHRCMSCYVINVYYAVVCTTLWFTSRICKHWSNPLYLKIWQF